MMFKSSVSSFPSCPFTKNKKGKSSFSSFSILVNGTQNKELLSAVLIIQYFIWMFTHLRIQYPGVGYSHNWDMNLQVTPDGTPKGNCKRFTVSTIFSTVRREAQNFGITTLIMLKRLNPPFHTSQSWKKRCRSNNWFGCVNWVKATVESLLLPCFSSFWTASTWD